MTHFSNISDRVKDAKNKMDKAQEALHTAHENPTLCMQERDAVRKYASTVRAEESFFKQKARIQWLSLGDQNTNYFHKSVNGRQNRNKLLSLTREDGEVVKGHEVVKSEVIAYFHRVLGVDQMPRVLNEEVVESTINLKLCSPQQHVLAQDVTREEIKHAMFSLKNNKAPGLDGFNAGFFKRMWHIVGEEVINAVRSFFQTRRMLKEMNDNNNAQTSQPPLQAHYNFQNSHGYAPPYAPPPRRNIEETLHAFIEKQETIDIQNAQTMADLKDALAKFTSTLGER